MSLSIDIDILHEIPLINFEKLNNGNHYARCKCPICGDSRTNLSKKRGNFYINDDTYILYKCFNCSYTGNMKSFLSDTNNLELLEKYNKLIIKEYLKYNKEFFISSNENKVKKTFKKNLNKQDNIFIMNDDNIYLKGTQCLIELPDNHPANLYVKNRKIPKDKIKEIYYTDNFQDLVIKLKIKDKNNIERYKYEGIKDKRIIFVLRDFSNKIIGLTGASITKNKIKYIHYKLEDSTDIPLIYGLNKIRKDKPLTIVEGILDSFYIDNCIASLTVINSNVIEYFENIGFNDIIIIPDNDVYYNNEVFKITKKVLKQYDIKIKLFDFKSIAEVKKNKDINDMIKNNTFDKYYYKKSFLMKSNKGLLKLLFLKEHYSYFN